MRMHPLIGEESFAVDTRGYYVRNYACCFGFIAFKIFYVTFASR